MPWAARKLEKRMVTERLPAFGYDYGEGSDVEIYLNGDSNGVTFEIRVSVVKNRGKQ